MSTREYTVFEHRNTPFCVPLLEYPYAPCPCRPARPPSARPPSACAAVRRAAPPTSAVGTIRVYMCIYAYVYMCAYLYAGHL